jgi:hypothetical protein
MTRLLLCTATILALTASANAQGPTNYFGNGGGGPLITGYTCAHTIAKGDCIDAPKLRVQQSKNKGK